MNIHVIILGFLTAAYLVLSLWLLTKYQRSASTQSLVAFLLGLTAMSFATFLFELQSEPPTLFRIAQFAYLAGVVTFSLALIFSWNYPIPSVGAPKNQFVFFLVPLAFFVPLIFFGDEFLKAVVVTGAQRREVVGSLYWFFPALATTYFLWGFINLFRKIRYLEGRQLRIMRLFVWALIASGLAAVTFDVILPAIRGIRGPYGIELSLVLVGITSYIAFKK